MSKWLNNALVKTVPMAPRFMVGLVARKYVSGKTVEDAFRVINDLNRQSFHTTVDILGEHIQHLDETEQIRIDTTFRCHQSRVQEARISATIHYIRVKLRRVSFLKQEKL